MRHGSEVQSHELNTYLSTYSARSFDDMCDLMRHRADLIVRPQTRYPHMMSPDTPPDSPQSFTTALLPSSLMGVHRDRFEAEFGRKKRSDRTRRPHVYDDTEWVEDDLEDRVQLIGSTLNRDMNRLNLLLQKDRSDARQISDWQARIDHLERELKASNTERDALRIALEESQNRSAQEKDVARHHETLQKQLSEMQNQVQTLNKKAESQAAMLTKKDTLLQKHTKASNLKVQKEKTQLEEALEKAKRRAADAQKKARTAESERDEAQKTLEEARNKLVSSRHKRAIVEEQRKTLEKQVKELKDELSKKKDKKRRYFW
ncbi:hypothetical protein BDV36DRAFT_269949 [Aspergillus pseudocaelatus]|uniref:Uncharacterized protein n=1 Tax=Aspergillus pseudocaelatus TaxID=1825620 RepID=A0ABQ6W740_9EURO|nr:hypothetical protein BDV36DRAFT_269949 [Aspergillus pseudocaelatus]